MARSSATLHALSVRFLAKTNGIVLNDILKCFFDAYCNHCLRILIEGPPIEEFDFDKVLNPWKEHGHRRLIL